MQVLIAVSNIILICSLCAFILFCITFIQNFSQTAGVEEPFIYLDHDPLANLTSEVWKSLQEPSPAPQGISGVSIYLKVESKLWRQQVKDVFWKNMKSPDVKWQQMREWEALHQSAQRWHQPAAPLLPEETLYNRETERSEVMHCSFSCVHFRPLLPTFDSQPPDLLALSGHQVPACLPQGTRFLQNAPTRGGGGQYCLPWTKKVRKITNSSLNTIAMHALYNVI